MSKTGSAASLALLLAACSQPNSNPPAPPPTAPSGQSAGVPPAAYYFVQQYGVSLEEAVERVELQEEVSALAQRLDRENDPAFSALWIEHEPEYRVVVAFADDKARPELLASLSPARRRHVEIVGAKRSRAEIEADMDRIIAVMNPAKIPYTASYDVKTERFDVTVGAPAMLPKARALIPDGLRGDVDVKVGPLPVPLARN